MAGCPSRSDPVTSQSQSSFLLRFVRRRWPRRPCMLGPAWRPAGRCIARGIPGPGPRCLPCLPRDPLTEAAWRAKSRSPGNDRKQSPQGRAWQGLGDHRVPQRLVRRRDYRLVRPLCSTMFGARSGRCDAETTGEDWCGSKSAVSVDFCGKISNAADCAIGRPGVSAGRCPLTTLRRAPDPMCRRPDHRRHFHDCISTRGEAGFA